MSKQAANKAAQRAVRADVCERCGATGVKLNRHHTNYEKYTDVIVLCTKCHAEAHRETGNWGMGSVQIAECVICGKPFQPKRSRRNKICSMDCLRELGRISAMKRWARG